MRYDGGYLYRQINSNFQTKGNNSDPAAVVKVTRHTIPISYWNFVERSLITTESGITDISVATKHTTYDRGEQEVWVAYVRNGKLKVKSSRVTEDIVGFNWISEPIDYDASSCAIAFNSRVERTAYGRQEFLTDEYPWVFWVENGALRAWQINSNSLPTELAAENVTDVSAVRGPSGQWGGWDLGLSAFFIMNGSLFYRQRINDEWYDAELVSSGPSGTYVKLAAYRTWDYRVCVQALMNDGKLYNLFTYTEGIGARNTEHIGVGNMSAHVSLTDIEYHTSRFVEHINASFSAVAVSLWRYSSICLTAQNIEDEEENWGTTVAITFDYPVSTNTATASMFTLQDSNGYYYMCEDFEISQDGLTMTLTFADFNLAARASSMTITYTQPADGGLMSPAVLVESFSKTFIPTGLVMQYEPPAFASAWNNGDMVVYVAFDEEITNADFSDMTSNFTIGLHEYNYVPNGTLQDTTRTVANIEPYGGTIVDLSTATMTDTDYSGGAITLEVDTSG